MAMVVASSSIRPRALQKTLGAAQRDFERVNREWQDSYPGFKERLPPEQRDRLKEIGRILWCFDIRFRWATGIREIAFDDEVVTLASTAPTREGYFLLMRLVDLWFSADLAFDMYKRLLVPKRVERPSILVSVKSDAAKRLRACVAAADGIDRATARRLKKPSARARLMDYLKALHADAQGTVAGEHIGHGVRAFGQRQPLQAHHYAAIAQTVRNRYVHGGETAGSAAFSAQEKVPLLRHLCGFTQILTLAMATAAAGELNRQLRMHARM